MLNELSYHSNLGISLKKNLHYFSKEDVMEEMKQYTEWLYQKEVLDDIALDYRIKSLQSISMKFDRYYPDKQMRKVFNDILGFRAFCDSYKQVLELENAIYRVADMSDGKSNDDGYRGVHLYYQIDNSYYPIEIQFNTLFDRQLNNWLHDYVYKKSYPQEVGRQLREQYEMGKIRTEEDFKEILQCVIS
jgi:putative GTP pyrophosphokinase